MWIAWQVLARLIQPMCGDAVVSHRLHFFGAYLNLDGHTVHAEQSSVKRLIAVCFRDRDIVFEATGHRFVQAVHGT